MRSKIDDATETRNKMRGFDGDAVEREICEPGEHLCLGLAREVAPPRRRILCRRRSAHQHQATPFERVAFATLVNHERHPGIAQNVLGVHRERRDQQERRAVGALAIFTNEQ
jgi:hypothetical protein